MNFLYPIVFITTMLLASFAQAGVIYQGKSMYRNIFVVEEDNRRCMWFGVQGGLSQSCIYLDNRDKLVFNYTRSMLGALYLNPQPKRILVIGLGGGILPMSLQKLLPKATIDSVELDPTVVKVAVKYFDFPQQKADQVAIEDGRVFVKRAQKKGTKFDLIMLDAFDEKYVPEHMMTRDFLSEIKGLLEENGVLAANTFTASQLYHTESATYADVFGPFYNLKTNNRVILLRNGPLPPIQEINANAALLEEKLRPFGTGKDFLLPLFKKVEPWPEKTRILTDQYSPANLLNNTKN